MASKEPQELSCIFRAENLNKHVDQYRIELNKSIRISVEKIIRENPFFLSAFQSGSASKDLIMNCLMDFATEPTNIEEFVDMIGDITTNLPDLEDLNATITTIIQAKEFVNFVRKLLEGFKENLNDNETFSSDELIWEISQTVADYVADLTVDFVWDRVINEDDE